MEFKACTNGTRGNNHLVNILISRQLVRKHCKDTANRIQFTYRRFWCRPSGSSGSQWCSRRRTGTSTGPDRRPSPPAAWWCQLSPAWSAALQSKHRKSRHAGASTGSALVRRKAGSKRTVEIIFLKRDPKAGKWILGCILSAPWTKLAKVIWKSRERKQVQTGNHTV